MAPFVHKYRAEIEKDIDDNEIKFSSEEKKEEYIDKKLYKYVKQSLQNFVFNINVPSRWGTQTPFVNITLDWICPDDLKDKALMLG
jgi:ribonucleoside-triphosphate reductase